MRLAQPALQSTLSVPAEEFSQAVWGPIGTAAADLVLVGARAPGTPTPGHPCRVRFGIWNHMAQTEPYHLAAPHALCAAVWSSDGCHILGWGFTSPSTATGEGLEPLVQLFRTPSGQLEASLILRHAAAPAPSVSPCGSRLVWLDSAPVVTGQLVRIAAEPCASSTQTAVSLRLADNVSHPVTGAPSVQGLSGTRACQTGLEALMQCLEPGFASSSLQLQHCSLCPEFSSKPSSVPLPVEWSYDGFFFSVLESHVCHQVVDCHFYDLTICSGLDGSLQQHGPEIYGSNTAWHPHMHQLAVHDGERETVTLTKAPDWQPVLVCKEDGLPSWSPSGLLVLTRDIDSRGNGAFPEGSRTAVFSPVSMEFLAPELEGGLHEQQAEGQGVLEFGDLHAGPPRWSRCGNMCYLQDLNTLGVCLVEVDAAWPMYGISNHLQWRDWGPEYADLVTMGDTQPIFVRASQGRRVCTASSRMCMVNSPFWPDANGRYFSNVDPDVG